MLKLFSSLALAALFLFTLPACGGGGGGSDDGGDGGITCNPPFVLNQSGTACVCPSGTIQNGNTCATGAPILASPSNLSIEMEEAHIALISWNDNASDETGFLIERRLLPSGPWEETVMYQRAVLSPFASKRLTGLVPNSSYEFRISAIHFESNGGTADLSTMKSGTPSESIAATTPPLNLIPPAEFTIERMPPPFGTYDPYLKVSVTDSASGEDGYILVMTDLQNVPSYEPSSGPGIKIRKDVVPDVGHVYRPEPIYHLSNWVSGRTYWFRIYAFKCDRDGYGNVCEYSESFTQRSIVW